MSVWEESFGIAALDGQTIPVHRWLPFGTPAAVVIISHGLGEYGLRYRRTGRELAARGYAVYANDLRGHGMAVSSRHMLGNFDQGGFQGLVDDMREVIWLAATEHGGAPIFLLGHSMGSYLAQLYMLDHSATLAGVVLTGGSALDLRSQSLGTDGLVHSRNNDAFAPARTPYDWLSRDRAVVDSYVSDPLCGFAPSPVSQKSLYAAAPRLCDMDELRRIRKDLPILMCSGELDPVNGFLRYFNALFDRYHGSGLRDVRTQVYAGARHELLNELNRDAVMGDLASWIEGVLERRHDAAAPNAVAGGYRVRRQDLHAPAAIARSSGA